MELELMDLLARVKSSVVGTTIISHPVDTLVSYKQNIIRNIERIGNRK
jgi:hypothetical protein